MTRLVVAALITCVLAAVSLTPFWTFNPVTGTINLLVTVSFVVTGVALAGTPDHRLTAYLLVATAGFWLVSWWWAASQWQVGPVALVSYVCGYLWFVCGGIALLRYPEGKLSTRFETAYFSLLGSWVVIGKLALATIGRPEWSGYTAWSWWPSLAPSRTVFDVGNAVFNAGIVLLAMTMLGLLITKLRHSRGVDRIDALPVMVAACTVTVSGTIYLGARLFAFPPQVIGALQTFMGVAALITPLAFLLAVLRRRLAHLAVADLVVAVAGASTPDGVEAELRRVLGDESRLWMWNPATSTYTDTGSRERADLDTVGGWRHRVNASDGTHLAVVVLEDSLRRIPTLVHSVLIAAGLALEVQSQIAEIATSRRRVVDAADAERQRVQRDLHDGVQQVLLAVGAHLSTARIHAEGNSPAVAAIDVAQSTLRDAVTEIRNLAQGLHPVMLDRSGLATALNDVVERLPLNVKIDVPAQRVQPEVEKAIYYITCESLTNVVRHAQTDAAAVTITYPPGRAELTVIDRGRGGAEAARGTGLAGMRARVETLGGSLTVGSVGGVGTTVRAVIPCA